MSLLLTSCARIGRRDSALTNDIAFEYAEISATCGELWIIHEKNADSNHAANQRMKQIRGGW